MEPHLRILHAIAEAASHSFQLDDILTAALDALGELTGPQPVSLHLLSSDGTAFDLQAARGLSPRLRDLTRKVPLGQALIGRIAARGETLHVPDVVESKELLPAERVVLEQEEIRAFVGVPLESRDHVLGVLFLGQRKPRSFDPPEIALLEATANQIGLVVDNVRLYAETLRQLQELRQAERHLAESEKMSTVGRLAAGLVHEINNPLTMILGEAHFLATDAGLSDTGRERLSVIIEHTSRAARMLSNLLRFSRHQPPQRHACSLVAQVEAVLELMGRQLERDGIRVVTEFEPVPDVWADGHQLQQVLLNIVENAHHALAGQPGERGLIIRVGAVDGRVRVAIRDTGPGIPPAVLPRIFDAFVTTKPPGEGTGLGLWVAYGILERHGGRLRAENHPEGGAVFILELPLRRP